MGKARRIAAFDAIDRLPVNGSFLDVGCGRGTVMGYARELGYSYVSGVDVVPDLFDDHVGFGEAHNLPFEDNEFNVVTCFDVLEHLLPEDTIVALNEISRVASDAIILCIANYVSMCNGHDLHINKRPYEEWDKLIGQFVKGKREWIPRINNSHSETWIIRR